MNDLHTMNVRELFSRRALRCTWQREQIYKALAASKSHPTAEELHRLVAACSPGTSLATIYNTLDALCKANLCRKIPMPDGTARFDADLGANLHAITEDGRVLDVPEDLEREVLDRLPADLMARIRARLGDSVVQVKLRLES